MSEARSRIVAEALLASAVTTGVVTAVSALAPTKLVATLVGLIFLAATWFLVWRKDDARVVRSGLSLGGVVLPGPLRPGVLLREAGRALAWGLGATAVVAVPYFIGWKVWWHPHHSFSFAIHPREALNDVVGQLVIIALPEEAFYRGYLQSRLDEAWEPRWKVLGATIGLGLLVSSAIFAVGHLATVHLPVRLAVFFPSLAFGWLRARTGGIGAGVVFHASCNLLSEVLGRGYGIY